ncbi:MAG: isoaspartyl peptidase/L-asparaginase [Chitinophagaceae bacterium]|nr:isoaspartyl peptidase/L-asparaginase [Chitinophagaceae bacterium]
MNPNDFAIAIHGGAGTIAPETMTTQKYDAYMAGLKEAIDAGFGLLQQGASSLDAVEAAVRMLEDCPLFNAGKGAVFNHAGQHEMDAAIMYGKDKTAGAVCGIGNARNPVQVARAVMERTEHVLLSGAGANAFAIAQNLPIENPAYFFNQYRYEQWQEAVFEGKVQLDHSEKKMGTVGAVAKDKFGNLAAATSTGGMTNKQFGRVGDSPLIGVGTWADDNTCAISCTGHGELFMRSVVAYDIACLIEYKGLSLQAACDLVVMDKLVKIGGEGGLVAIDKLGNIELPFNSSGMYRGYKKSDGGEKMAIYK